MSEQNQNPPSPAPVPAPTQSEQEPTWLKPRLEQAERAAERKVLERLGVTDIDAASKAIQAARQAEESNKSAEQKAAELAAKLTAQQAEAERLAAVTREHAGRLLGVLTAEQQAAVKAVAGEDPAKQLHTIMTLGPTWSSQPTPAAPVNTAPPPGPPGAEPHSPPDHRAVYESERAKSPFAAAVYGLEHQGEVFKPRS